MLRLLLIITLFFGNCFFAEAKPKGKNIMKKPAAHKSIAANTVKSQNNTYLSFGGGVSFAESVKTDMIFAAGNSTPNYPARLKNGFALQGAIGHYFNKRVRAELSYTHLEHKINESASLTYSGKPDVKRLKSKIKSDAFLANVYYHPIIEENLSYYLMAGLGISRNDLGNTKSSVLTENCDTPPCDYATTTSTIAGKKKSNFAWNVGTGIQYKNGDMIFDITYKYMDLGKTKASRQDSAGTKLSSEMFRGKLQTHQIVASIGILF